MAKYFCDLIPVEDFLLLTERTKTLTADMYKMLTARGRCLQNEFDRLATKF